MRKLLTIILFFSSIFISGCYEFDKPTSDELIPDLEYDTDVELSLDDLISQIINMENKLWDLDHHIYLAMNSILDDDNDNDVSELTHNAFSYQYKEDNILYYNIENNLYVAIGIIKSNSSRYSDSYFTSSTGQIHHTTPNQHVLDSDEKDIKTSNRNSWIKEYGTTPYSSNITGYEISSSEDVLEYIYGTNVITLTLDTSTVDTSLMETRYKKYCDLSVVNVKTIEVSYIFNDMFELTGYYIYEYLYVEYVYEYKIFGNTQTKTYSAYLKTACSGNIYYDEYELPTRIDVYNDYISNL